MSKEQIGADKPHHNARSTFWRGLRSLIGCGTQEPVLKSDIWNIKRKMKRIPRSGK